MDSESSNTDDAAANVPPSTDHESSNSNILIVKNPPDLDCNKTTTFVNESSELHLNAEKTHVLGDECQNLNNQQNDIKLSNNDVTKEQTQTEISSINVINLQCENKLSSTLENTAILNPPETTGDTSIKNVSENNEQNISLNQIPELNLLNETNLENSANTSNLNFENVSDSIQPESDNLSSDIPNDSENLSCKNISSTSKDDEAMENLACKPDTSHIVESVTNLLAEEGVNIGVSEKIETNTAECNDQISWLKINSEKLSDSTELDEAKMCSGETDICVTDDQSLACHTKNKSTGLFDTMKDEGETSILNLPIESTEVKTSTEVISNESVTPNVQLTISDSADTDSGEVKTSAEDISNESTTPNMLLTITESVDVTQNQDQQNNDQKDGDNELTEKHVSVLNPPEIESTSKICDPVESDKTNYTDIREPSSELKLNYTDCKRETKNDDPVTPSSPAFKGPENSGNQKLDNISQINNASSLVEENHPNDSKSIDSKIDSDNINDAEVPIISGIEKSENLEVNSALSNESSMKSNKEINSTEESSEKQQMMELMEVDEIEPSVKTAIGSVDSKIAPTSNTGSCKEIVSENLIDAAAHSVELQKNIGKDDANVPTQNIEVSGKNESNEDQDLKILSEDDQKLLDTNKSENSEPVIKVKKLTDSNSVSEKDEIELEVTPKGNDEKSSTDLPANEEMPQASNDKSLNKGGDIDSPKIIDDTVIYEKFECKPLTIRADINMEELQKLKSAANILGEPVITHEENIKDNDLSKKSSEEDSQNTTVDSEAPKITRSTTKTLEKSSERKKIIPKKVIGPAAKKAKEKEESLKTIKDKEEVSKKIKEKEEVPKKTKDKEEISKKIKDKEEIIKKIKDKEEIPKKIKDKEEVCKKIKDKEEVSKKLKDKEEIQRKIKDKEDVSKKIKEKEELSKKVKEKGKEEVQKKIKEKVEKPAEEEKPKIKCKKMDIQETRRDTREPSKRLIIKSQSSINESVQPTKKSTQADVVDLEVVDEKYTKNPMRMYEVCKELGKMARTQLSKKEKKIAALKSQYQLEELTPDNIGTIDTSAKSCDSCKKMKLTTYKMVESFKTFLFCSMICGVRFKLRRIDLAPAQLKRICCGHCNKVVLPDEKSLSWKTNNYCDEKCLTRCQQMLGDACGNCNTHIPIKLRGRYILQRGNVKEIFCSSMCRAYHKSAFKYCTICNKASDGSRMTMVNKYKICSQECLKKFSSYKKTQGNMSCCTVCHLNKPVQYNVLSPGEPVHHLCSEKCFKAFNFVNKLDVVQCNLCERYFDKVRQEDSVFCFFSELFYNFCSKFCHYVYMRDARGKTCCAWCKGEKNEPSMVRRVYEDQEYFYCTLNCLNMLNVEKTVTAKSKQCDYCKSYSTDTFYVSSYSATKSFCTYKCVYNFHNNIPCTTQVFKSPQNVQSSAMPKIVISDVRSLNATNAFQPPPAPAAKPVPPKPSVRVVPNKIIKPKYEVTKIMPRIIRQILVKPQEKKEMKNAATQVHVTTSTKRVSCKTTSVTKEIQTGEDMGRPSLIPVPVPLYVPAPAAMYSAPFPVLVPVPIPVPVPIFIPTTRNSAAGIFKEIKRIQEKIPADPFEAELLMMAEMVASDKKDEGGTTDDDSNVAEDEFDNEGGTMESSNNAFGEDVLQMAIKMACNDLEPGGALQAVDLDDALQPATITITQPAPRPDNNSEDIDPHDAMYRGANRGRKRGTSAKAPLSRAPPIKRQRRTSDIIAAPPAAAPAPPPPMEIEKPDANMCLKYTFGVNAWRQWVVEKNQELEKAATAAAGNRKPTTLKLFKPEILQLTADELNFSLCLFVQEVRKPNGTQYAPDTIYYLCLGIQQYLFESGRIDNIFTDPYYEKFTEALDEVCCKFSALYNDTQFIVTRVEEEHLWESKQLGAHSPHVLLNTLMFFNTKHFNLITVEEHMQLSFSHIMKHWKRNPSMAANIATNCTKAPPGSRNVLLRFYPPQSAIDAPGSRKKKVYEQQENEENPLRCPVRLYEFYLSKCPESVKTRNDVFYLLPERSCVPDSPVWYSTTPLNKEALMKMLHRIKMVKEINIAFLSL